MILVAVITPIAVVVISGYLIDSLVTNTSDSDCIQPPSPHKFALWNEDYCWWFLYEPLVPFERITFQWSYGASDDPLGEIEEWCEDNGGLWFPNNNDCKFIHNIDAKKAKADLESRKNIKVSGSTAQRICEIINFPCLEPPEFNGKRSLSSDTTFVNLFNQGTKYNFRLINDTFSYKISTESKSGEWIEEKIDNPLVINVTRGAPSVQLGGGFDSENNSLSHELERIIESCECKSDFTKFCGVFGAAWSNGTHSINNNTCEWKENKN